MNDTPNPGSPEAYELGCTCPILDNGHGRGPGPFWINAGCPLHDLEWSSDADALLRDLQDTLRADSFEAQEAAVEDTLDRLERAARPTPPTPDATEDDE